MVFFRRALQQFETYHDGEVFKLHQFEVMQLANLMQADSEVEEVRCYSVNDLHLVEEAVKTRWCGLFYPLIIFL